MIFLILIFCSFSALLSAVPVSHQEWHDWKLEYGKVYSKDEELVRYNTWLKNKRDIDIHNANFEATYEAGLNEWSDLSQDEFAAIYLKGLKVPEDVLNGTASFVYHQESSSASVPNDVNWVDKGYVTGVKNQGRCGSCYTFGATGALEGQWKKKTGKLLSFSEQQLVDCSTHYHNHGCHGGWYHFCWRYIKDIGGIESEEAYKYTAHLDKCKFNKKLIVAGDTGYVNVRKSEDALKAALSSVGPIAVAIDASRPGFRNYKRGVFYDPLCSKHVSHAVLAVGYGTENGQDYWLIKNSWGTRYGLGGYIKMARNKGNMCSVATYAAYPTV